MTAARIAAQLEPEDTAELTGSVASVRAQLTSLDLTIHLTGTDGAVTDYHVVIANPKSRLLRSIGRYIRDYARHGEARMHALAPIGHPPVKSKRKGRR